MSSQKVLHNLVTFLTYTIGAAIMLFLGWIFFIAYILYCVFSTIWFMKFICTNCPHYRNARCPSSYSIVAAKLFKKGNPRRFNSNFKKHIGVVFPSWFIPVVGAIYILLLEFSFVMLGLLVIFVIVGFILLPVITKRYGCNDCKLKDSCPRMAGFKKR